MAEPTLREYRDIVTKPDGSRGFLVTAQVTSAGSGVQGLPFKEVFVLTINDPLDPKADVLARVASPMEIRRADNGTIYLKLDPTYIQTFGLDPFARVANVAEFTQLARDRDTALGRGQREYLSSSVSFLYDDAVTATAAFRTIVDRVSQLVTQWIQYRDGFLPNPPPFQDYSLPQVSIGVESELTAAFVAARTARQQAEDARDEAQRARDDCSASYAFDVKLLQVLQADVAALQATLDAVAPMAEAATAVLVLTGGTTLNPPGTYTINISQTTVVKSFVQGSDPRSVKTLYQQKINAMITQNQLVAQEAATCQQREQDLRAAQAAVTTAQAAEAAALAAVVAVCPTFNPATV
jgi:hypothetical protein